MFFPSFQSREDARKGTILVKALSYDRPVDGYELPTENTFMLDFDSDLR